MPGETKDARPFFAKKKYEEENKITLELSFLDSLFKLRKKIEKGKDECKAFDNIRHYNHNLERRRL